MMKNRKERFCHKCGTKIEANATYCTSCGYAIKPVISSRIKTISSHPPVSEKIDHLRIVENRTTKNSASGKPFKSVTYKTISDSPSEKKSVSDSPSEKNGSTAMVKIDSTPKDITLLPENLPPVDVQHVWYNITAQNDWSTAALVSVSENLSTIELAHGLGYMAAVALCKLVWVINASTLSSTLKILTPDDVYDSSKYPYDYFDLIKQIQPSSNSRTVSNLAIQMLKKYQSLKDGNENENNKAFIAIDSLLSHTDAIPISRAVDKIILCVEKGATSVTSAQQIIKMVGRQNILGCVSINLKR
jgi:hypothetical protein